jgi:hypothetical protein
MAVTEYTPNEALREWQTSAQARPYRPEAKAGPATTILISYSLAICMILPNASAVY